MNQVTTTDSKEVAVAGNLDAWGSDQVSSNDLVVPKILAAQYMSEVVKAGEVKFAELYDTSEHRVLGGVDKPLEFIPFHSTKYWMEYTVNVSANGQRKREYRGVVGIDRTNDNWPRVSPDGTVERDRVLEFYVLRPEEIAEGCELPYILSFRRSSLRAGKQLTTQMSVKNRAAGKNPAAVAMSLGVKAESNDDGEFAVMTMKPSRESTAAEQEAAFKWLNVVRESNVTAVEE